MGSRALVFALFAVLGAAPLAAGAAGSVRPLRTVTFDFDLHVAMLTETPGARIPTGTAAAVVVKGRVIGGTPPLRGSGESAVKRAFSTKGSIVVEVMLATEDAGLVVDVAETATDRTRPKVRMAVATDGTVLYDTRNSEDVTEEELALVRWMARGFYGDHPTDPGTSWTVDQSSAGRTDLEHYKVVERNAQRVTLDYTLDEKVEGVGGYQATRAGSLVYDTSLVVPVKATFQTDARRQVQGSYGTTRTTVALTLTSDSFAAPRKP